MVYLDGKFLKKSEAKVSIADPGLLCGFGVFETMRSLNQKIVYLDQHIRRIIDAAKLIGLKPKYSASQLKSAISATVKRNSFRDACVRLTSWQAEVGTSVSIIARKYQAPSAQKYKQGFSSCVSSLRQTDDSKLARIKTTSRALYQLSLREAEGKGFDEALILNSRGYITEAARSNIFLVKEGKLLTPSLDCGCLDGITRRAIFDLARRSFQISEGKFTVKDLFCADEAFLTNSLMGVMPLTSIDGKAIGNNQCGKITKLFIKKYRYLLK